MMIQDFHIRIGMPFDFKYLFVSSMVNSLK